MLYWGEDVLPVDWGLVGYYDTLCLRLKHFSNYHLTDHLTDHLTPHTPLTSASVCSPPRSDTHWALHQLYSQQTTGNPFVKRFSGFTREHHSLSSLLTLCCSTQNTKEEEETDGVINVKLLYIMLYQAIYVAECVHWLYSSLYTIWIWD